MNPELEKKIIEDFEYLREVNQTEDRSYLLMENKKSSENKLPFFLILKVYKQIDWNAWTDDYDKKAEELVKINDPAIAKVYGAIKYKNDFAIVLESISELKMKDSEYIDTYSEDEAKERVLSIIRKMEFLKEQGFPSFDLKPSNFVLSKNVRFNDITFEVPQFLPSPNAARAWLRYNDEPQYYPPSIVYFNQNTPEYAIYMLGVVLYELMLGQKIFKHRTSCFIHHYINYNSPKLPFKKLKGSKAKYNEIIKIACHYYPDKRFKSLSELSQAIVNGLQTEYKPSLSENALQFASSTYQTFFENRVAVLTGILGIVLGYVFKY